MYVLAAFFGIMLASAAGAQERSTVPAVISKSETAWITCVKQAFTGLRGKQAIISLRAEQAFVACSTEEQAVRHLLTTWIGSQAEAESVITKAKIMQKHAMLTMSEHNFLVGMKFRCEGAVYEDGARRISPGHTAYVTVRQNSLEVRIASMPYYATLAIGGVTANSVITEHAGGLLKAPGKPIQFSVQVRKGSTDADLGTSFYGDCVELSD